MTGRIAWPGAIDQSCRNWRQYLALPAGGPRRQSRRAAPGCWLVALFAACFTCAFAPAAFSAETVTLLFNERPPYLIANRDGSASGLTGTPTAKAFQAAGIAVNWSILSTRRQIQTLSENSAMSCAIGWFYKPEREEFARFSKPLYRDHPFVGIATRNFRFPAGSTLEQVLLDKKNRILVKEGFSYGDIDPILARTRPTLVVSNGEVVELMQMLKGNRADLMFAAWEEAEYLIKQAGFKAEDFRMLQFPDMPEGKTRHLMCSKKVSEAMMARINAALGAQ